MAIEYKVTGSDEHDMTVTITIDGVKYSYDQVGEMYNTACDSDSDDADDAIELEEILSKAARVLQDAQYSARHQRVSSFYRDNPNYQCEDSDPVIRNW